ncbi:MAG: hypothetical protein JXJ22_13130 [Bacteroidales bacterium]|nr:hypothetical protein [Bacteroidales bacterium]
MKFVWSNKGILVPVYLIATGIAVVIIIGLLQKYVGGIFISGYDYKINLAVILLISGTWTYFTGEEYIKKDGKKVKINLENEFFGISMKIWGYMFLGGGVLSLILGIKDTLAK